ncbi:glycosyltransferase [Arthrobacter agilis]|uniref:glycosyltransferase n=1 Tax=Arthrobacter agilis TaxID=37921 RepID=UPI0023670958|nr:glycosyltransferase [Arthrobacter agilis]WDF32136.1 glycosyltransferase [Arthrobacter agilis]
MKPSSVAVGFLAEPIAPVMAALGLDYASTPWQRRSSDTLTDWTHESPPDSRWWGTYLLKADSLAEARSVLPLLRSEGRAERFVLVIDGHEPGQDGEAPTVVHLTTRAAAAGRVVPGVGYTVVIEGDRWVPVHAAATAALASVREAKPVQLVGGLRLGITDPRDRAWLVGDPLASLMTPELLHPEDDDIYAVDVIVGSPPSELPVIAGRRTPDIWVAAPDDLPPVDISLLNPRGFLSETAEATFELTADDLPESGILSDRRLAALRTARYVTVDGTRFDSRAWQLARWLTQAGVAGVPLLVSDLPQDVRTMVGQPLVGLIQAFDPHDHAVQRESKSIDLRRAAMEEFAPAARWSRIMETLGRTSLPDPTVTVLLATKRPDKVGSALAQVADQSWDRLELVLVLHGFSANDHPGVRRSLDDYPGVIVVVEVPGETVFGDVLRAGTAAAGGEYLTKMDDDDWYGPHHVRDLVRAIQHSGAQLVGSQVEFVYLESLDITTRRPSLGERYSDHVAGGTMLLRLDDLRRLGGWRPVHRAVDRCLLQAVQAAGGLIYRSHGQNYLMHRYSAVDSHGGHTWNPADSTFLQSVAGQWDGFVPPPQIQAEPPATSGRRDDLSSYFRSGNRQ